MPATICSKCIPACRAPRSTQWRRRPTNCAFRSPGTCQPTSVSSARSPPNITQSITSMATSSTPSSRERLSMPEHPGFFGANFAAHLDPSRLTKAVAETKRAGVWIVPTQGLLEIFMSPSTADQLRQSPGVEYMPAPVVEGWVKQRQAFIAQPGFDAKTNERFLAERRKLLKALHDAGVDIAMGSDAVQTFSVPGFSIQNEMGAMSRSGLTPYQIYVTGSRNVARFFNRGTEAGTIAVGRIADLVLVDADPLADVANFGKQTGTMVRGRWYPRVELLAKIKGMP